MQKFEPGESVSYTEILGNAVYFGIVANTVNKQAHMDSNFATKVLNGASGNVTTGAYTENGAVYLVASVPNGGVLEMDGKSNILWCPEENRNNFKVKGTIETYPKETLDAYVDSMINHVSQKSTTIGNRNGYIVDNLANSKTIDIENCEAGTYYFDMSNYAQYGIDDLKIKKKSNQVVVLNYPTSNKVTLKRFELVNDGVSVSSATSNQTVDKLCRSIIFNMPQATEIDFASATAGLFIAPKATVTGLGGTSSGWIVVNSFTNNGGEWHCVYGELPKPENVEKPAQESFSVSKTVDGSTPTVDQKFVFRLEQIGDVPNGTTPISAKTVENNGAKVDFGTIKYNKEGTYYYRITETGKAATTSGEYTLDSQSYVVKIVVTANVTSSGNITTTEYNKVTTYYKGDTVNACTEENKVTGTTGITFNNETIEQKGNLKIVKAAGAGTNLVGKTFYFKISDENGNVVKNSNNSDVWSITFSANVENAINIENLEPGKYRVSETDANGNGVTTGEAFPYVVTGGGLVTVEGNKTANVVVTNTKYEAAGSLVLTAEKKLEGKQLEEGKYSFVLKDSKGTELQTKQNGADGSVSFDAIEYTLA
ncbi:FctA domain-containing protein, partial [Ruminococcus sp. AM42-11]|uniref:Spy0128 family protein n=1 Tax=Ruminococcus sp. AM42-11 TaxID=2292372 RepID=UPI0019243508